MKNLKQFISVLFLSCLLATTLSACKSTSVVPPTTTETATTKTITEVIRDTVFITQKDSSYYKAYLKCIDGKVVIDNAKKPQTVKGNHLKPPNVEIKDNVLQVNCESEAQKLFAQWKETYISQEQKSLQKIPYPVPAELSGWQITQIYLGRFLLVILALLALGFAFKNRI